MNTLRLHFLARALSLRRILNFQQNKTAQTRAGLHNRFDATVDTSQSTTWNNMLPYQSTAASVMLQSVVDQYLGQDDAQCRSCLFKHQLASPLSVRVHQPVRPSAHHQPIRPSVPSIPSVPSLHQLLDSGPSSEPRAFFNDANYDYGPTIWLRSACCMRFIEKITHSKHKHETDRSSMRENGSTRK